MSIELSSAPASTKSVSRGESHGKKSTKTGGEAGEGINGFAELINQLTDMDNSDRDFSADGVPIAQGAGGGAVPLTDAVAVPCVPTTLAITQLVDPANMGTMTQPETTTGVVGNLKLAAQKPGLLISAAQEIASTGTVQVTANIDLEAAEVGQKLGRVLSNAPVIKSGLLVKTMEGAVVQKLEPGGNAVASAAALRSADAASFEANGAPSVHALLANKASLHAQVLNAAPKDLNDFNKSFIAKSIERTNEVPVTSLGQGDFFQRAQARFGSGQSGSSGFDGAFGGAAVATTRAQAVFEVPPASAVIPETAVAETVSYWASHGVQTAELKLDGFGDAPVEVSIFLNGDLAQIDFRTDQLDVRRVLEGAAIQLKELLSNDGLQLAGVSVGSTGQGGQTGKGRHQHPAARQISLLKTEAQGALPARSPNIAVGRALDLFV